MGNKVSATNEVDHFGDHGMNDTSNNSNNNMDDKNKYRSFPGSAILEKTLCGSIDTTDPTEYRNVSTVNQLLKRAEILCVSSPVNSIDGRKTRYMSDDEDDDENSIRESSHTSSSPAKRSNNCNGGTAHMAVDANHNLSSPTHLKQQPSQSTPKSQKKASKLLARALVSEVTDNPKTMNHAALQERERRLLKAVAAAAKHEEVNASMPHVHGGNNSNSSNNKQNRHGATGKKLESKPVGASAPPHVLRSMAFACTGDENAVGDLCPALDEATGGMTANCEAMASSTTSDNDHASSMTDADEQQRLRGDHPHTVTIGVALSRHSPQGHAGTITRQTTYDWNELQDRSLKYMSAVGGSATGSGTTSTNNTSNAGWRGGGGEADADQPDQLHIPIIHLHCPTQASVDEVICVLARGDIFIPFMSILPEQVSTVHHSHSGMTDLVVTFGCERHDDVPIEEWPNWCLEFMHNQLYDYFSSNIGSTASWMKRSFSITLAQQVRWKTVKHMNRYFEVSEAVVKKWRDQGPQRLFPSSSPSQPGGASADEVARPHGIYLYRGGVPTNYFAPNFAPPYTTKMTRSLLHSVLQKSWDKKRREWSSRGPVPRLAPPSSLLSAVACGYDPAGNTGYMAKEVTMVSATSSHHVNAAEATQVAATLAPVNGSTKKASVSSPTPSSKLTTTASSTSAMTSPHRPAAQEPLSEVEFGRSASGDVSLKENHVKSSSSAPTAAGLTADDKKYRNDQVAPRKPASTASSASLTHHAYQRYGGTGSAVEDGDTTTVVSSVVNSVQANSVADSATTVLQSNVSRQPELRKPFGRQQPQHHPPQASVNVASTSSNSTIKIIGTVAKPAAKQQRAAESSNRPANQSSNRHGKLYRDDGSLEEDSTCSDLLSSTTGSSTEQQHQHAMVSPKWLKSSSPSTKEPTGSDTKQPMSRSRSSDLASAKIMGSPVSLNSSPTKRAQFKMDQEKAATITTSTSNVVSPRARGAGGSVEQTGSMEYSTDGSSAFFTADAASLYGQHLMSSHDGDTNVNTPSGATTIATTSTIATTPQRYAVQRPLLEPLDRNGHQNNDSDEEEDGLLLLQESSSSTSMQSVVPTDEELFSVGWAKALDPNSGSYYYFTLDRTRTVWENPLTSSQYGEELPPPVVVQKTSPRTAATTTTSGSTGASTVGGSGTAALQHVKQPQRRAVDP